MYGIMKLQGGGPPGSGEAKHEKFKGSYKTGSRKGTAAGDKGDKKSQAKTARELDQMILSGDVTRGGEDFLSGKISAAERRQQLLDLAKRGQGKGIPFALDPEEFTGNLRGLSNAAKIGKLRGDMSPSDYHNYMRALHGANPAAMEKAFPWGSGAALRGLANLAVPAPLKMLGSMVGDLGTGAKQALGQFVPEGMKKDLLVEGDRLKKSLKQFDILRDAKGMLTGKLDQNQIGLINTIKDEEQTAKDELLKGTQEFESTDEIEDLAQEILFGTDEGAATETVDASQNIAYDPTRPINYASEASGVPPRKNPFSPGDELDNLLIENELDNMLKATKEWPYNFQADPAYWDPSFGKAKKHWLMPENVEENIFDPSQNVMPNVPITREQKVKAIDEAHNWLPGASTDDEDWLVDLYYNRMREAQEKGKEYGSFEGVINKPERSMSQQWQYPNTPELVNQINWNTANRPLDWSGGETPELTEDFIKENITTDWDFNQGGYLKKYDDGGYANMSTYEKLKAINDSIAEG